MVAIPLPRLVEGDKEEVGVLKVEEYLLPIITPGFSLTILFVLIVLAALSIILTVPLPLFMAALLLLIANRATRSRIEMVQRKREGWKDDEAGKA